MRWSVTNLTIAIGLGLVAAAGGILDTATAQTAQTQWPTPNQGPTATQWPSPNQAQGLTLQQAPPPPPPSSAASVCNGFLALRDDAQKKGTAIGTAEKRHAERQELCKVVATFYVAEEAAIKFLEKNKTLCGVPEEALTSAKATHEKTLKFRENVCAPAPQPRVPTLSDAISTPSLDTAKNTKTNTGTFNTLTGNPLAR